MNVNKRRVSIIIAFLIICASLNSHAQQPKVENFVVYTSEGKRCIFYDLFTELPKNGVLLVNFTSVYCKPCKKEIPQLAAIADRSKGNARLICIYAEGGKPVKENASSLGIKDRAYVDPFGNIQKQCAVSRYPVTFVIDCSHTILSRFDGYTEENIRQIEKLVLGR